MKLKDYIREGYNVVTSPNLAYKIQEDYPNALVFTDRALDAIPIGKLLVDLFYSNNPAVLRAKPLQNAYAIEHFSREFIGYEKVAPMTEETRRKLMQQTKKRIDELALDDRSNKNLLEIKLKDTDSVPEVLYRGERVDELPNGLVDVYMHWHTREFNKSAKLLAALEYIEGIDTDAKRIEISIDEEGECGYFNLLKDEIDD
jgi:arginyl-tRNA--protein-N-Asp/Glu arginylyltransferase